MEVIVSLFVADARMLLTNIDFSDDTCVQTGYWPAVAEFVASLGANDAHEK